MSTLRQLLESVRHSRPEQIAHRVRLTLKRRIRDRFPRFAGLGAERGTPPVASDPPLPPFPPRTGMVRGVGRDVHAHFLGVDRPLTVPMRWHVAGLPRDRQLHQMTLHYMEYLEALDDDAFEALVRDWIAANPAERRGAWFDGWNSFALSIRVVIWMQQCARRSSYPPVTLASLAEQLRFLEHNLELDLGGNHLIKNVKALLWAGRFFDGDDAARWSARGRALLGPVLDEQILPDGVHYERSPAYHTQVFADLLECHVALRPSGDRERLGRALHRMAAALADLTHPDGLPSLFNDGALHMAYSTATCLDTLRAVTGDRPDPRRRFALRDAGYFGARDRGDLVVFDCGPIAPDDLPAHGHGDILAFEWSVDGARVVVDTGVFEYHAGARRARSRSTAAHNTVTVDDADQCEFWSAFRVARRTRGRVRTYEELPDGFRLVGAHDGYRRQSGGPVHVRDATCTPRRIEVRDRVDGGDGQAVRARILLAPGFRVELEPGGATLSDGTVTARLRTDATVTIVDAPWYPDFGEERETVQLVLDYGRAPCSGGFVLSARGVRNTARTGLPSNPTRRNGNAINS